MALGKKRFLTTGKKSVGWKLLFVVGALLGRLPLQAADSPERCRGGYVAAAGGQELRAAASPVSKGEAPLFQSFRGGILLPGYAKSTNDALVSLTRHLPFEQQQRLTNLINSKVSKTAGQKTLDPSHRAHAGSVKVVKEMLGEILAAHQEWINGDPVNRRRFEVASEKLETPEGIEEVVWALQGKDLAVMKDLRTIQLKFCDKSSGAVFAFKQRDLLEGYASKTVEVFKSLFSHLSENDRKEMAAIISQALNERSGEKSYDPTHKSQAVAARAILEVLGEGIRRHNLWVEQDSSRQRFTIELSKLGTAAGVREAIWKLQKKNAVAQEEVFQIASEFIKPQGGVSAFSGGSVLPNYSSDPINALASLGSHLNDADQREIRTYLEGRIANTTGKHSLDYKQKHQPATAKEVLSALAEIFSRHNEWVREERERELYAVSLRDLREPSGVKGAIEKIRAAQEAVSEIRAAQENSSTGKSTQKVGGSVVP